MIIHCSKHNVYYEFVMGPRSGCGQCEAEQNQKEIDDIKARMDEVLKRVNIEKLVITKLEVMQ